MKYKYLLLLLLFSGAMTAQENWESLLKDKNLSNFEKLNGTAEYEYEDGVLTGITKANTPNTFLATKKRYNDFILEFEVKIEYGMNSGVQFRSNTVGGKPAGRVFGYQAEIETSPRKWAGGIYDEGRRGWLYPLSHNENGQNAFINGTWNTAEGFIAFQVHDIGAHGKGGQKVQWKNMRILTENIEAALWETQGEVLELSYLTNELTANEIRKGWRLLWDGKTTKGWRSAKSDQFPKKGWTIEKGILKVEKSEGGESENGGDIITIDQFSNFELVLDFKISEGANSGIKYFVDPNLNKGKGSAYGLEFQILDDGLHPDAKKGVNGNRTVGSLYDLIPAGNLTEANRNSKRFS
jgi:hypothetical protein